MDWAWSLILWLWQCQGAVSQCELVKSGIENLLYFANWSTELSFKRLYQPKKTIKGDFCFTRTLMYWSNWALLLLPYLLVWNAFWDMASLWTWQSGRAQITSEKCIKARWDLVSEFEQIFLLSGLLQVQVSLHIKQRQMFRLSVGRLFKFQQPCPSVSTPRFVFTLSCTSPVTWHRTPGCYPPQPLLLCLCPNPAAHTERGHSMPLM